MKKHRTRKQLLQGLPALIALAASMALFLFVRQDDPHCMDWYRQRGDAALTAADYSTASICYTRLLDENPSNSIAGRKLAMCLESMGQHEAADKTLAHFAD